MLTKEFKKFIKDAKERNKDDKDVLAVLDELEKDPKMDLLIKWGEDENNLQQRGSNN